jgi:glycerol-3-phosphate acyltransferase PlsY
MVALHLTLIVAAYLVGSVSTAVLVCRLWGLPDPRAEGSGNPGATNVLRLGGRSPAALTLLGDALKGALPVLAAKALAAPALVLGAVMLAAILGHLFPIFFRLKGGKGVSTTLGAATALAWPVGLAMALTWLLIALLFRYSSLSSIAALLFAPFYFAYFGHPPALIACAAAISALLIYRHAGNIRRLLSGTEGRIGERRVS